MNDKQTPTDPVDELLIPRQALREHAHGLLNDLCVVLANAQCSLSGETDPERVEDLTSIITAAKRAEERIHKLRQLYQQG